MNLLEEKTIRIEAAQMGAELALSRLGLIKDEISQREAYRLFGEAKVRSWLNAGYVTRVGAGTGKTTYSRIELQTVANLEGNRKLR